MSEPNVYHHELRHNEYAEFYLKYEADKVIAEKDKEIAELKALKAQAEDDCAYWKMNEGNDANAMHETEEYAMQLYRELRATRRALWLARADRALEKIAWFKLFNASISTMNPEDGARQEFDKWKKALGKCLKKAEEYK